MKKISIIIPVYNVESYIDKCLASIIKQTYQNFEAICVDDGSTDKSGEICDRYSAEDARIRVIHKSNGGVSSARNIALDNASGDYITFVDGDDYIADDHLEILYNGIKDTDTMAICGMFTHYINKNVIEAQNNLSDIYVTFSADNSQAIANCITNRSLNYIWGKLFVSHLINSKNLRFKENITLGEDTLFLMQYLTYINGFRLIDKCSYYYVKRDRSLTSVKRTDIFSIFMMTTDSISDIMTQKGVLVDEVLFAIDARKIQSAIWACQSIFNDNLNIKQQNDMVNSILNNNYMTDAFKRFKRAQKRTMSSQYGQIYNIEEFKAISKRSAKKLRFFYDKKSGKYAFKNIVKIALIRLFKLFKD